MQSGQPAARAVPHVGSVRTANDEDVAALAFFVGIPVAIEQAVKISAFTFDFSCSVKFLRIAAASSAGAPSHSG